MAQQVLRQKGTGIAFPFSEALALREDMELVEFKKGKPNGAWKPPVYGTPAPLPVGVVVGEVDGIEVINAVDATVAEPAEAAPPPAATVAPAIVAAPEPAPAPAPEPAPAPPPPAPKAKAAAKTSDK